MLSIVYAHIFRNTLITEKSVALYYIIMMSSQVLGGPYNGFSAKQTVLNYKDGAQSSTRSILRNSWNTALKNSAISPFRVVNNGTGSGNVKYVHDSSAFVTYRRQKAINQNYNDLKNGGDDHNGSFVAQMAVRR